MKLGLNKKEIRLVEYTSEWVTEFNRVKKELIEKTNIEAERIQHIGSTSIQGMSAKPIIDIVVGVDNLKVVDKALLKEFSHAGFLRLRVERPGEIVMAKFTDDTYQVKTHFIHLVEFQQDLWNNLIFFRDYLNEHKAARDKYLEIKLDYLKDSSTGIDEYTDFKADFVKSIFK